MNTVAIVGAGPAGIAAAVQLRRLGRDFVLFEKDRIGGLVVNARLVENYPGFPDGIPGPELVGLLEAHLARLQIEVRFEEVLRADPAGDHFVVRSRSGDVEAGALVIASGTAPVEMDSPTIPPGAEERILSEVHPIREVGAKRMVIVGAGDAAFDYALTLASRNRVAILIRGPAPRCIPLLRRAAEQSTAVEMKTSTCLAGIRRSAAGLTLDCAGPGGPLTLDADYLLLATGRRPNLSFLAPALAPPAAGPQPLRRWPLYFVGDVARGRDRQTALAVGDGVDAAMQIHAKLAETGR
jgi:thioredoxin reductase